MIPGATASILPALAGGAPWTPIGESWLVAYYEPNAWTLDGTGKPDTWVDSSGNARTATAVDETTVHADGVSLEWPATYFGSGPAPGFLTPSLPFVAAYIVAQYKDGTIATFLDGGRILAGTGPLYYGEPQLKMGNTTANWNSDAGTVPAPSQGGAAHSYTALPMPMTVIYIPPNGTWNDTMGIGYRPNSGDEHWSGRISAVAFTDGTESAAEIDKMVGRMAHASGCAPNLIVGHPYRDAPP